MNNILRKIAVTVMSSIMVLGFATTLLIPFVVSAQNIPAVQDNKDLRRYSQGGFSLVQCDGVVTQAGEVKCDFTALVNQIKFLVRWMFYIAVPIATGLFAYAGGLFMTATQDNIKKAKGIFKNVVIGFIIMLLAWLIVRTILLWIAEPGFGTQLLNIPTSS